MSQSLRVVHSLSRRSATTTLILLAALTAATTLGGCYERVVSARGMGADQYNVTEPYQENSRVDDWVFGTRPKRNNTKLKNISNP